MDIYANLNQAKMLKSNDPAEIDKSIARLLHMAHKDKFRTLSRYYLLFCSRNGHVENLILSEALSFYKASTVYNENNLSLKNKAFLNLAEINYQMKNYKQSYNFYDSLQAGDTTLKNFADIQSRKNALAQIVRNLNVIDREDSLQLIAAMPEDRKK